MTIHSQTHTHNNAALAHSHSYADGSTAQRERALSSVVVITLVTMVCELVAGWWTSSLALTADGWHMGTHALALGGAVLAYRLSARAAVGKAYAFGGWKIEVLAAYTSGLALMGAALWLIVDSALALQAPRTIAYGEAATVAALGLVVNLVCAWLLTRGEQGGHSHHGHAHNPTQNKARTQVHHEAHDQVHNQVHNQAHKQGRGHDHQHGHSHAHSANTHGNHGDHNFNAATLHVLADAFTSVLALLALGGGALFGLNWLDPAVALLGALVIGHWSIGVLQGSARALVDATADPALSAHIQRLIESDGDAKITDLHVWQVGSRAWCAALSVVADAPLPASDYRDRLSGLALLRHVTVEVHGCTAVDH